MRFIRCRSRVGRSANYGPGFRLTGDERDRDCVAEPLLPPNSGSDRRAFSRDHDSHHDYKDTLFLPKTDFPMRAGLPAREPEWLARWERLGLYQRLRQPRRPGAVRAARRPALRQRPPPHRPRAQQDPQGLGRRSQQMMGYDFDYVPGWDCHGLPIEWKIEEQYRAKGKNKDEVPVNEFRAECRRFAEHWIDVQRTSSSASASPAIGTTLLTMAFHAEAVIAAEFMKFVITARSTSAPSR